MVAVGCGVSQVQAAFVTNPTGAPVTVTIG
jgi:hypothetical protein